MPKQQQKPLQALSELAFQVQQHSHSPYSNFKVGAALIDSNDKLFAGCNVENASYPLGQCAEASAISAMVAAGGKRIKEILIASPNGDFCPPCGGCRQKIKEFADEKTLVHMVTKQGKVHTASLNELLPLAFTEEDTQKLS